MSHCECLSGELKYARAKAAAFDGSGVQDSRLLVHSGAFKSTRPRMGTPSTEAHDDGAVCSVMRKNKQKTQGKLTSWLVQRWARSDAARPGASHWPQR